jgi:hypothetical protein
MPDTIRSASGFSPGSMAMSRQDVRR